MNTGTIAHYRYSRIPSRFEWLFYGAYLLAPFSSWFLLVALCLLPLMLARSPGNLGSIFIVLICAGIADYFIAGAGYLPESQSAVAQVFIKLAFVIPLFFLRPGEGVKALAMTMTSSVVLVLWEAIYTITTSPTSVFTRAMISQQTGEIANSTGMINAAAAAAAYLLFIAKKPRLGWLGLAVAIGCSAAFLNRTGFLIAAACTGFSLLGIRKLSLRQRIIVCLIPVTVIGYFSLSEEGFVWATPLMQRLANEGLESERYFLQGYGLSMIWSASYPLGGAEVEHISSTHWYHNILLDAYRMGGFPCLLLFMGALMTSFIAMLYRRSTRIAFVWIIGLFLSFSSVPLEGGAIEFYTIFAILCIPFLREVDADDK